MHRGAPELLVLRQFQRRSEADVHLHPACCRNPPLRPFGEEDQAFKITRKEDMFTGQIPVIKKSDPYMRVIIKKGLNSVP